MSTAGFATTRPVARAEATASVVSAQLQNALFAIVRSHVKAGYQDDGWTIPDEDLLAQAAAFTLLQRQRTFDLWLTDHALVLRLPFPGESRRVGALANGIMRKKVHERQVALEDLGDVYDYYDAANEVLGALGIWSEHEQATFEPDEVAYVFCREQAAIDLAEHVLADDVDAAVDELDEYFAEHAAWYEQHRSVMQAAQLYANLVIDARERAFR